ncbi:MAG: hypothetical protein QNJ09_10805 [Paracoccaceae bacterium]|nr:hypothetical protein [Paracoccaceae bacterium]
MRVISLTSIPPRFAALGPTLEALLAQGAEAVVLSLPKAYRRFPGDVTPPALPEGVTLHWVDRDFGSATKLLGAAQQFRGRGARVLYCDDDVLYAPGWAKALYDAHRPGTVTAASCFGPDRLGRTGPNLIAQGFAGVVIEADRLDPPVSDIPEMALYVDDIWLSGHYARLGLPVHDCPTARAYCTPQRLGHDLQDAMPQGIRRAEANAACAAYLSETYGIWPKRPLSAPSPAQNRSGAPG